MSEDKAKREWVGDCFVIVSTAGLCWDGKGWVKKWKDAMLFDDPVAAYTPCEEEWRRVREATGVDCLPFYVPPFEVKTNKTTE